ncbi:histidinol dehydrogenase [Lutimonas zeaxanthinifaciens]|uniref:histidinol dehydrogenase n=1 Tax=Lutimonas zeaxanthinifaciens TaxID=3060215 RepID=UPI00265CDA10|nr:histidinol dehydrogenase [Lutimonas sp. YSD2104]WKK67405.1 histidinol dehydrogenase [Lutimonas sp. YSD2104]
MKILENPLREDWEKILKRPTQTYADIEPLVTEIFENISENGDEAVKKYTAKFDRAKLNELRVSSLEIDEAKNALDDSLKQAINLAKKNIEAFHASQQSSVQKIESTPGVVCWQEKRAIEKVGLYIPGGTAPLFSTILMLAVPASIAGCEEVVMCTPCNDKGKVHPAVLYTADLCGVTRIFKVGGIQAIAGMTLGTESIPKVYKIFGPGNQFVTVAKQMAMKYGVGIDLPAGPSELLVYADKSSTASFMAADLLSQAEHGADSQVILVSNSLEKLGEIRTEIYEQLKQLPRIEIAAKAIENSKLIYCNDKKTAIDLINFYAPEHLILSLEDTTSVIPLIINAGSVFVGDYSPESAGDYASGTNHTLPTNGFAKNYSGVNLDAFQKAVSFQEISKAGIRNIGSAIEKMAEAEGLFAHQNAVTLRLAALKETK